MIKLISSLYYVAIVIFVVIVGGIGIGAILVAFAGGVLNGFAERVLHTSVDGMLGCSRDTLVPIGAISWVVLSLTASGGLLFHIITRVDNRKALSGISDPVLRFLKANSMGVLGGIVAIILLIAGVLFGFLSR